VEPSAANQSLLDEMLRLNGRDPSPPRDPPKKR
jgi:hypothetical protein